MRIKCDYCGGFLEDTDERCPNCGSINSHLMRSANGVPKTIEELQDYCHNMNVPLKDLRFFIGVDYREPKAFGIYRDEADNIIVYKNKADGTRVERYRGTDEAYAVNEIYQKLLSEKLNQEQHLQNARNYTGTGNARKRKKNEYVLGAVNVLIFVVILFAILALLTQCGEDINDTGYYDDDSYYYNDSYYDDDSYYYNDDYDDDGWSSDWNSNWNSDWGSDDWSSDYSNWSSNW